MNVQLFKIVKVLILELPLENPKKKCDLNVTPQIVTKYIIGKGMSMLLPKGCRSCKACV